MTQAANLAAVGSLATSTGLPFSGASVITSGTAVASTSGTSIDFTSIPSWVKRITVMFNGVSNNSGGVTYYLIQIGSGSVTTSGYTSNAGYTYSSGGSFTVGATTGFILNGGGDGGLVWSGGIVLTLIGSNTWVAQGVITNSVSTSLSCASAGNSPALSGSLDRVRITTTAGTATFDAGSINILYE